MSQAHSSPEKWIASAVPVKTVAGVKVAYDKSSYKSQYYSIEWLAETFGEQITTADNPRQELIHECERRGYLQLQRLFTSETS
jgi:hypothetical protein